MAWRWARGQRLDQVLERAELAPGDFVRNVKQLIDLLRQLAVVGRPDTAAAARRCGRVAAARGGGGVGGPGVGPRRRLGPDTAAWARGRAPPGPVRRLPEQGRRRVSGQVTGGPPPRRRAGRSVAGAMFPYAEETFTADEVEVLRRYVTNLDGPVFALVNLPEVVKGALFARYSRSAKSLRRLFLDEFVGELDVTGDAGVDATMGLRRAEELYERVFLEYGDDSVAQLGGVHLACEQASNVLTKVLEWGRLMAYLEQSTRYVPTTAASAPATTATTATPRCSSRSLGARYVGDMDRMFDTYGASLARAPGLARPSASRSSAGDSDFVYRQSIRAKALDALRGLLPAASLSNVGVYGTGQSYEMLLLRMRAHPLPEARALRASSCSRSCARSSRRSSSGSTSPSAAGCGPSTWPTPRPGPTRSWPACGPSAQGAPPEQASGVRAGRLGPRRRGQGHRGHVLPAHRPCPTRRSCAGSGPSGAEDRRSIMRAYVGDRTNRRHRPGPGLRAHRLPLRRGLRLRRLPRPAAPPHAHHRVAGPRPRPRLRHARRRRRGGPGRRATRGRWRARPSSTRSWRRVCPDQAPYAVALAFRIRYAMQMNAREAMHVLELRSGEQGHPAYRVVAQDMHRLIAEHAGHRLIAEAMTFVDHQSYDLERLGSEKRAEARRSAAVPT